MSLTKENCGRLHPLRFAIAFIGLFVSSRSQRLGYVTGQTDFLLSPGTVRRPDVAFITGRIFGALTSDVHPWRGLPAPGVEVVSPGNYEQDMFKKIRQYLGGEQSRLGGVSIHEDDCNSGFFRGERVETRIHTGGKASSGIQTLPDLNF